MLNTIIDIFIKRTQLLLDGYAQFLSGLVRFRYGIRNFMLA